VNLKGKRVLVTGADGFIGSHLAECLVREGCRVTALVQYNSLSSWGWLDQSALAGEMEVVAGDIRDSHLCLRTVKGAEVVFHLAALIPIPYSYRAPESYVDTNVKGTLHLCQASVMHGVEKFIQTSTSEVYGTARYVPIDESHPLQAQSPYSATKIGADAVAVSFANSFQLPVTVARPFNTYGPRQSARAVIPTIIGQLAAGATELKLGDITPTRDFTFVLDTCAGFLAISKLDNAIGEVYNIGSHTEISVGDLAREIAELMGVPATILCDEQRLRPVKSEVQRLLCNNKKLQDASGFQPQIPLRDGLNRTIEWLKGNLVRYKTDIYNV